MPRQPDGDCWPQWLRKINAAENPRRVSSAVSGRLRWQGKRPVIGWLAQRHALESQFPLNVQDVVSQGAWPGVSLLRGLGAAPGDASARCWSGSGWRAWRKRRSKRSPAASFSACYLPGDGAAGAAGDARRALHRVSTKRPVAN